jgi:epoxide hydrolase
MRTRCSILAAVVLVLCVAPVAVRAQAPAAGSAAIVPFKMQVPDAVLRDLKGRLAQTRWPNEIAGSSWEYGADLAYVKQIVTYWRDTFDWRAQERKLNQFDQFKTKIDGLEIHFIHQRSKELGAMPLVLTHGWPGSVVEFTKVIGPLTDPVQYGGRAEDAFNVVAISLPGFGFSGKPDVRGYSPERIAKTIATLMGRLGYVRYGAQGGHWGGIISRLIAIDDAPHVAGLHLNFCTAGAPPGADPNAGVPAVELQLMQERNTYMENERAYQQIQATKPQTLGFGLNDSPAALAAWIVEKFHAWCDCGGNVESRFTKDELLSNIMVYWATQTGPSSVRIYFENRVASPNPAKVTVPTACAQFPKEISAPPRKWLEARYNLTRYTLMPRGGHFAALEQPELLVNDIRAFFHDLRGR